MSDGHYTFSHKIKIMFYPINGEIIMNTLITYKLLTDIQTSQVAATPIRERPHQIYFERYVVFVDSSY